MAGYVTTKRTFATTNSTADLNFFAQYFGPKDPSATYSPGCLNRALGWVLPDKFGMHFPQSFVTADSIAGESLADWERVKKAAPLPSAWDDYATSFWVPDLGAHVAAFRAAAVPFAARRPGGADRNYVTLVRTPGSGQAMELQSPRCSGCDDGAFVSYPATECAAAHALPRNASYYASQWRAAAATGWANVTAAGSGTALPAPIVAQLRVAVADAATDASAFLSAFLPDWATAASGENGQCRLVRASMSTAPFDAQPIIKGYELEYVFVQNDAAEAAALAAPAASVGGGAPRTWAQYQAWMGKLHEGYVGMGVGFDRGLDFHVKIMADDTPVSVTHANVTLDAWAALHEAHGVRYHAFNVSNACPVEPTGDDDEAPFVPPFVGSAMLYSAGIGGVQGIEFWGALDRSHFGSHQLFGWNACSSTMGCETGAPPPMCSATGAGAGAGTGGDAGETAARARAFHDPLTELATLELACAGTLALRNVSFASFGTPLGDCATGFAVNKSCHAPAEAVVAAACVGRDSCTVPLVAAQFGADPCPGTEKWLAVEASCA